MQYNDLAKTLISLSGNENVITVRKPFVQFTGSLEAGMMLSQLLYWTPRARIPGGWIAKSDKEFHDELCLSSYAIRKARKEMEKMGILETTLKKFAGAPTTHYRLKMAELRQAWAAFVSQMDLAISQDQIDEMAESSTETTTETTTHTESVRAEPKSKQPQRDYLTDAVSFAQKMDKNDDRVAGYKDASEEEYRVCERVAQHWRAGILAMHANGIDEAVTGARMLLKMHQGDLRATLLTLDRYHLAYTEDGRKFTVSGPQSLLNEIPAFLARNGGKSPAQLEREQIQREMESSAAYRTFGGNDGE